MNAANSQLTGGGGVNGAIHRAGGPQIAAACRLPAAGCRLLRMTTLPDGLPAGEAVATTAGRMRARFIVHTVGPVYSPTEDRSPTLRCAYTRSLQVTADLGAHTVAFPLLCSGAYGWPIPDAAHHANTALRVRTSTSTSTSTVENTMIVAFSSKAHQALLRQHA